MKKLFLIDAYAVIYRAYYAFIRNPRVNSKGMNTSAILGFVNTLEDVLKREEPTHIAVAFDPSGKTFRHEAYEAYKAQREATPEDIRKSVPLIKDLIRAYNIALLEEPGYEADDVIGTVACQAAKQGFEVYMLTPDKDYGQLVSDRIFMYRPRHKGGFEVMGTEAVKAKYGLDSHEQMLDLLALMGDASDNIPGCPGVGEKTAVKLLQEFGSIDRMFERSAEIKRALRNKIEDNKEQIIFSRFLATIKTDVPLKFEEEALRLRPVNESELRRLFDELEFRSLAAKVFGSSSTVLPPAGVQSLQMSLFDNPELSEPQASPSFPDEDSSSGPASIENSEHSYQLLRTREERAALLRKLQDQKSVCFDTETTGLDVFRDELVGLSFCFCEREAYFVLLPENRDEALEVLAEFRDFFGNPEIEKIGHNLKFDLSVLTSYGIALQGRLFDTMIAHYLLQPEMRHGMDYLADIYLKYRTITYEDLLGEGKNRIAIRAVDATLLCNYAAEDADITFRLKNILEKELRDNALERLFYDVEMPLVRVLERMERSGVRIDTQALEQSSEILAAEARRLEDEIQAEAGRDFNVSSPRQVGEVLFETLKIDAKAKKTKTGQYSTSEDILEKLRSKHPVVGKILDYRGLKKLLSTYIDALPALVNPQTGRIHSSYNQTVTATGRLSSSNPNLQNIPIRDAQGKEIRKAFIPNPDSLFMSADYSQIELRIMAHLSQDANMIAAFLDANDIHSATAAKIYRLSPEEVTSDMRRKAKTANFGIIYGISAFGLSERLNIPRSEAKELIDGYFESYPQVKEYMDASIRRAKELGYVETLLGRKRFLPDINSQNNVVRGFSERNAINAPIQGSAADIIKLAMIRIQERFERENLEAKMIMQVHDELNFSVPVCELDAVRKAVVEEMEGAFRLRVPLVADCGYGANWLEAH